MRRKVLWTHPCKYEYECCVICGKDLTQRMKVAMVRMTGVEWDRVHVCSRCARAIYKLVYDSEEFGIERWAR